MLGTPFLTELDSRAAVKGSRDPLGIQSVWTGLGRKVVGNLTTVSNSVRDFTTLILGYYAAERLAQDDGAGSELATFLKWEQLVGYVRALVHGDTSFRGARRVKERLEAGKTVTLSAYRSDQILGNQKTYGLWGLYTSPARTSGLVTGSPVRLTPPARGLCEQVYLPILDQAGGRDGSMLLDLLRRDVIRLELGGRHEALVAAVAKVFRPKLRAAERALFAYHLRDGGPSDPTSGRQARLAGLLYGLPDDQLSPAAITQMAKQAAAAGGEGASLAHWLERIRACESVVAPLSAAFSHLLGMNEQPVAIAHARLREAWGPGLDTAELETFDAVSKEIAKTDVEGAKRWKDLAEVASAGDYGALVERLVGHNAEVMSGRGGSAWIQIDDGRFKVKFFDEGPSAVPPREELATLWRFPYFLDSLRSVTAAVA